MYTDFETLLEPVQGPSSNPESSWTIASCNHIPYGWAVYSKFAYGEVENPLTQYRGPDYVKKFCDHIIGEAIRLHQSFPELSMNPLIPKEMRKHKEAKKCSICFKTFTIKNPKVRDHCHYSGKYRGAAHRNCNLQYNIPSYIPVVFHNLSGYDAHLFIKELEAYGKMNVIAKNKEDYISFSTQIDLGDKKIELRFIDSFKFMSSSLNSLTNNLVRGGNRLFGFENFTLKQYELLTRKGIYPYEYMSSWDKFEEELPCKKAFYNKLNMSGVSSEDYEHACKVWREFEIKNMGEYQDLYLRTDMILLANVLESFREVFLKNYLLDSAHFFSVPGLAWNACLKKPR